MMSLARRSFLTLLLLLSLCCCGASNNKTDEQVCTASGNKECAAAAVLHSSDDDTSGEACSLYLAISSIPGAGWGLYAGVDLLEGETVSQADLLIPIADPYKTLPYRGQQRFLSWLGYIWPAYSDFFFESDRCAVPDISYARYPWDGLNRVTDDEGLQFIDKGTGERISVFSPGVGTLANSHAEHMNIKMRQNGGFVATNEVTAGSELFLNYGAWWHKWRQAWEKGQLSKDYETLSDYNNKMDFSNLPTEEDKRAQMDEQTRQKKEESDKGAVPKKLQGKKGDKETENQEHDDVETKKSLDWLQQNGLCVDTLHLDGEKDGAFTKRSITKGQMIAPAPLLTLKRDDLVMYELREGETTFRNALNFDKVVGQEELLNYCYGHPDSQVLVLPYSPVVNFIRHSSQMPNAKIQWSSSTENNLNLNPVEILEMSGKLRMDFVALRDIQEGEEILVDFGSAYETASREPDFRHERGVPAGFYPDHWLNASVKYEVDLPRLQPGEIKPLVWKHNRQPVATNAYRVGLKQNFTQLMFAHSKELGIINKYENLLFNNILESDDWFVFDTSEEHGEWFAQRYQSTDWDFNMHYVAAWSEVARKSFLKAMHQAGFQILLETIGQEFGLQNLTCFHVSYMGVSECDMSVTHTDVYATGELGYNIIFPILTVPRSAPELDIQSDDPNIVIRVNYEHDTAIVMGDWVYHKTSPIDYSESGQMRIVVGQYCAQVTPDNKNQISNIYDGEDPAPFVDHWLNEIHWNRDGEHSLNVE